MDLTKTKLYENGKMSDGMSLVPWKSGQNLVWDAN